MGSKVRPIEGDENSCSVRVHGNGSRKRVRVTHFDDYGVLVWGALNIGVARAALVLAGYDPDEVAGWAYRPFMADQEQREWPNGLAGGGVPSVAFYFAPGGLS